MGGDPRLAVEDGDPNPVVAQPQLARDRQADDPGADHDDVALAWWLGRGHGCQTSRVALALKPGYLPSRELARDLLRFIRQNIAPYRRPRRLEFVELPKTISGKIRRVDLRQYDEKLRRAGSRGEHEYWENDFPEL